MLVSRVSRDGNVTLVTLSGDVTESAELATLRASLRKPVRFDLEGVTRVSSFGVRELETLFSGLGTVELVRCSPAVVSQLNMIPALVANAAVRSVFVPMECPACGHESRILLEVRHRVTPTVPRDPCARCGKPIVMAEPPERYFAFLT